MCSFTAAIRIQQSAFRPEWECLGKMAAGYTLGDTAENLVEHSVGKRRVFFGVEAETVGGTEQDGFITHGDFGKPGDIHQSQIHGNAADDRSVMVAHNYAATGGQGTIEAVGITDW